MVVLARVVNGRMRRGQTIRFMANDKTYIIDAMGVLTPKPVVIEELTAGEVGFFTATIKNVGDTKIGDTVTDNERPAAQALPGFMEIMPMVFAGLYTVDSHEHTLLRDALEKLRLNDSSFFFEPESSVALGFGFRCGFLGLLHMEIIQERIEREYNLDLITTAPGVRYRITLTSGDVVEVENPSRWPEPTNIEKIEEPIIKAMILTNEEYVGGILKLVEEKRGRQLNFEYVTPTRVMLTYELPLNEIVLDFYDRLKSVSRGYASLDYQLAGMWTSPMVKMDILVSGEPVDALSIIVHRDHAFERGKALVSKMRELIPRQQFEVAIQAAIGSKIVARETVAALRKNVIAKCYGGDISRKRKLLEKQKEGKKRMKRIGKVDIPQEAFLAVLRVGEDSQS
jgi:GTP-binding protein LepA